VPVLVATVDPSRPYRRPLLATGLDDASSRTFALALRILGPEVRDVGVVHASHVPFEGLVVPAGAARGASAWRRTFQAKAEAGLDQLLDRWRDVGLSWRPVVKVGDPRTVILDEVMRHEADLVVLGTHGRSGVAHALLGSVAEWVIAAVPCDVLIARPVRFAFELP
jgi:nucleotide-binding universal stress UspA family protein